MANPTKVVLDGATGEETIVELTDEEVADLADAAAAVEAAQPPLVGYVTGRQLDAIVRTTDDVAVEVFRFPCDVKHLYRANLTIFGVDAVSGASKAMEGRFTWKRPSAAAVMVGITIVSDIHDAAAAAWAPNALPQGTDIVFTVKGAAGRTIDWALSGPVAIYAPEGLS